MVYRLMQSARNTVYGPGSRTTAQIAPVMELFGDEIRAVTAIQGKFAQSPIRAAVIAHMVDGHDDAIEQFASLNAMDFDAMTPAVQSLMRQIIDGGLIKRDLHALAGRAWRAFHPGSSQISQLRVKDMTVPLGELREALLAAETRRGKKNSGWLQAAE